MRLMRSNRERGRETTFLLVPAFHGFAQRAYQWQHVGGVAEQQAEDIILVTHGAFAKSMAGYILMGELFSPALSTPFNRSLLKMNTGVTVFQFTDKNIWQLVRWNDTVHLDPDTETY